MATPSIPLIVSHYIFWGPCKTAPSKLAELEQAKVTGSESKLAELDINAELWPAKQSSYSASIT